MHPHLTLGVSDHFHLMYLTINYKTIIKDRDTLHNRLDQLLWGLYMHGHRVVFFVCIPDIECRT